MILRLYDAIISFVSLTNKMREHVLNIWFNASSTYLYNAYVMLERKLIKFAKFSYLLCGCLLKRSTITTHENGDVRRDCRFACLTY